MAWVMRPDMVRRTDMLPELGSIISLPFHNPWREFPIPVLYPLKIRAVESPKQWHREADNRSNSSLKEGC